ncbi:uncharacterized protein [Gossypium hirsutum]|uniref:Uncharacterized protein isoform X2 n=1 Tax=Gossypium hirsutum TaxID=3635 RepID=A0A1U8PE20_GOSHI|nr:uncharacterized protein LOC107957513 isoform X2 [Gossypium hirsutum]
MLPPDLKPILSIYCRMSHQNKWLLSHFLQSISVFYYHLRFLELQIIHAAQQKRRHCLLLPMVKTQALSKHMVAIFFCISTPRAGDI